MAARNLACWYIDPFCFSCWKIIYQMVFLFRENVLGVILENINIRRGVLATAGRRLKLVQKTMDARVT